MNRLQIWVKRLWEREPFKSTIKFDKKLTNSFHEFVFNHKILYRGFYLIRIFSNTLALPAMLYILWTSAQANFLSIIIIWGLSEILIEGFIKKFFARIRPESKTGIVHLGPIHFTRPKSFSFPSGHSFNAGFFLTLAIILNLPFKWMITLLALLVALSRVALGFHYFVDIIAGLLTGIFMACLVLYF